jgi:Trp operon repressor
MRELIFEKIEELQRKTPTLKKFFSFSLEKLNDNPEECLKEIEEYLEKHKDKITDFSFDFWIDEETFKPIILIKINLIKSLSDHLYHGNILNLFLPSSMEEIILRERISNVLLNYNFDLNSRETRNEILEKISYILDGVEMEDITTNENIYRGIMNLVIIKDVNKIGIDEYLKLIGNKKRHEKEEEN